MSTLDTLIETYTGPTGIFWGLDDPVGTTSAADLSGNAHPLTMTGSPVFGTPGIVLSDLSTCCQFPGSGTYGTSTYEQGYAALTVGCVLNVSSVPSAARYMLANGTNAILRIDATGEPAAVFNGVAVTGGPVVPAQQSVLVVATFDGATIVLYTYNLTTNALLGTQTGTATGSFATSTPWQVGANSSLANNFVGSLGRVFVLPLALTAAEVAQIAAIAAGPVVSYPVPQVLVSLADPWSRVPTFVDITNFVRSVETAQGRQHELQQIEASTIELLVDDRYSIFAPWNTRSPFVNRLSLVDSALDNGDLGQWSDTSGQAALYVSGGGLDGGYTVAVQPN